MVPGQVAMDEQPQPKPRRLKVEEAGDYWRKRTRPLVRLQGKWMLQAGIQPNSYVEVTNPQPGVLVLHIVEKQD